MQFLLVCEAPERGNARCNGSDTLLRCLKGKRSPKQAQDTNLSLPSSGNTKLQRDKCRAGELIQGSHCESQMCAPPPTHRHRQTEITGFGTAIVLPHSFCTPRSSSFISKQGVGGGGEVIACDTLGREKGAYCITPPSWMLWEQNELDNSGII